MLPSLVFKSLSRMPAGNGGRWQNGGALAGEHHSVIPAGMGSGANDLGYRRAGSAFFVGGVLYLLPYAASDAPCMLMLQAWGRAGQGISSTCGDGMVWHEG